MRRAELEPKLNLSIPNEGATASAHAMVAFAGRRFKKNSVEGKDEFFHSMYGRVDCFGALSQCAGPPSR